MATYSDLFEWVRPKAGAIAFIKFKGPMSSEQFGAQLAEAGIGIKPAYCFTDLVTDDIDYFRIVSAAHDRPWTVEIALVANGSVVRKATRLVPITPVDAWLTVAATQGYGENALPAALDALTEFVEAHEEEWRFARATMARSAVAAARL